MSMATLQQDAIGSAIEVTIRNRANGVVDLSTTSARTIFLVKPNGSVLTKDATLVSGGTTGIMEYVTVEGDLDVPGEWRMQARFVNSLGTFQTNVDSLPVLPNVFRTVEMGSYLMADGIYFWLLQSGGGRYRLQSSV